MIARETVDEVLSEAGAEASPAAVPDGVVPSRSGHLSAVGVLSVPPWRAGLEVSALPEAYRDLLELGEDAGPARAENLVRGSDQQRCSPGHRAVMITSIMCLRFVFLLITRMTGRPGDPPEHQSPGEARNLIMDLGEASASG